MGTFLENAWVPKREIGHLYQQIKAERETLLSRPDLQAELELRRKLAKEGYEQLGKKRIALQNRNAQLIDKIKPIRAKDQNEIVIDQPALLVTHLTEKYAGADLARLAADKVIFQAKQNGMKVLFCMDNSLAGAKDGVWGIWDQDWLTDDAEPTVALESMSGQHNVQILTDTIWLAGGYYERCLNNTMIHTIQSYSRNRNKLNAPLRIFLNPDAIFYWKDKTLKDHLRIVGNNKKAEEISRSVLSELKEHKMDWVNLRIFDETDLIGEYPSESTSKENQLIVEIHLSQ